APAEKGVTAAGPAGGTAGPFQIQIGAFNTPGEAERPPAWGGPRAAPALGRHAPPMTPPQRGGQGFFPARAIGFEGQTPADACGQLKRLEIDCMVMRAE